MKGLWTLQVWSPKPVSKWFNVAGAVGAAIFVAGFYDGLMAGAAPRTVYGRMRYRLVNPSGAEVSRTAKNFNQPRRLSPHRIHEVRAGGGQLFVMRARGRKSYCVGFASGLASRYPHPAVQVIKLKGELVVRRWSASGEVCLN